MSVRVDEKKCIAFESALKVIECIAADDEEKPARIRTLDETYKKQDLDKICGYSGLLSTLVSQVQNEEKAKEILEEVESAFPKSTVLNYSKWSKKEEYKSSITESYKSNEEENDNKKTSYVQKYHDGDLLAEAIIIGRKPYFAIAAPKSRTSIDYFAGLNTDR